MTGLELSRLRALLRAWLCAPGGGDLSVPGEGSLTWRDVVVTGVSDWDSLFEGGSCAVDFTCYDPVAYGAGRSCTGTEVEVLGTWPNTSRGEADRCGRLLREGCRRGTAATFWWSGTSSPATRW